MNNNTSNVVPESAFLDSFDCCLAFCQEKIRDNGEDSFYYAINEAAAVAAVFDGCGGAGAKRYDRLRDKTGAYVASRAVGGALKSWFLDSCSNVGNLDFGELKSRILQHLRICGRFDSGGLKLKGNMTKEFPTTMAAAVCYSRAQQIEADILWAGDSRGYLLNEDGLFLLTKDDVAGVDLYEDFSCDGVMNNVISLSKDFDIHVKHIALTKPGIVFAATDGCFGYFPTPMEFEFALLETMLKASGAREWEALLKQLLGEYASDDYTIGALAFGFGTYDQMKKCFVNRANYLYEHFIKILPACTDAEKRTLWNKYRDPFLCCMDR